MPRIPAPVLRQRIFEAKYSHGYRYLDRCGDAMLVLEDLLTKDTDRVWLPGETVPTGARITCPDLDITIVFSPTRIVVDQNPVDAELTLDFPSIASSSLATVRGKFGLRHIDRFGSRRVHLLPSDSLEDAEALALKHCPLSLDLQRGKSDLHPRDVGFTYVEESTDRSIGRRLQVQAYAEVGVEMRIDDRLKQPPHLLPVRQREALLDQLRRARARSEKPVAGLAIDIDCYSLNPSEDLTVTEFLNAANQEAGELQDAFLAQVGR